MAWGEKTPPPSPFTRAKTNKKNITDKNLTKNNFITYPFISLRGHYSGRVFILRASLERLKALFLLLPLFNMAKGGKRFR
jgi:hypothetical protein